MADVEEKVERLPDLSLLQAKFIVGPGGAGVRLQDEEEKCRRQLLEAIEKNDMAPWYRSLCAELQWPVDQALLQRLEQKNREQLKKLEEQLKDAEENHGESEVREALLARASYLCRIGDKDAALAAYRLAADKTVSLSQRLDISFTLCRMGFFFSDNDLVSRNLEKARFQLEEGGDWDRKNRLKVYEALYLTKIRDFRAASKLYLDAQATFTASELLSLEEFAFLSCVTGMQTLDRVTLKEKLLESPDILAVAPRIPAEALEAPTALHACNYDAFFAALASLTQHLKRSHWLATHQAFFCREMRIRAYLQLLQSYKSVQLKHMAKLFGVTQEFLDRELSRFIFSGRLHCKIDKVAGVVETSRADAKSALFSDVIREGDALLNRVQRLSRVVNL